MVIGHDGSNLDFVSPEKQTPVEQFSSWLEQKINDLGYNYKFDLSEGKQTTGNFNESTGAGNSTKVMTNWLDKIDPDSQKSVIGRDGANLV